MYKFLHQCVELHVKENTREDEYDDLYEVEEAASRGARAINPSQSMYRGTRAISIESFYDEYVVEVPDYIPTYDPEQVVSPTIESDEEARGESGNVVESYYVLNR